MNTLYIKRKLEKIEENKIYIEYDNKYDEYNEYNEYNQISIMKKIYDLFNCYK